MTSTNFRHKSLRKTAHDTAPAASKSSSNDNDSIKPNIGDDTRSRSAKGSSPVPGSTHNSEKRIDDIAKLTLGQGHAEGPSYQSPRSPSSLYNPLKRAEREDIGQVGEDTRGSPGSRARRAKAKSGGPFINQDVGFSHARASTSDPKFSRDTIGSSKRLFNPEVDNPVFGTARNSPDRAPGVGSSDDPMAKVARSKKLQPANLHGQTQISPFQEYRMEPQPFRIIKANHQADDRMELDQSGITGEAAPTAATQSGDLETDQDIEPEPVLLLQPETRPISHDQLVVEVKGIYAGLVLVESKCVDVDEKQSKAAQERDPSRQTKLTNEQWQALIHLHKTLLHEHHDFFLASQHPSASPALSKLAAKYRMPARMWRHGIHAFLEVLRHRLPESLDHMLAFIYIAYSMMALLYETVSTFENTWIECLGDLGRYRMAIEDDDPRDRDVWSGVARYWYSKAVDKSPSNGRLYHHLAILARPYTLQQLSSYAQSLTSVDPFKETRSSIMTLFNPILSGKESAYHRSTSLETIFIKAHGLLFCGWPLNQFNAAVRHLEEGLMDNYIGRITSKFREQGVCATVANISALFEYGLVTQNDHPRSVFRLAYDETQRREYDGAKLASQASRGEGPDLNDTIYKTSHPNHQASPPQQITLDSLTPSELESSRVTIACASRLTFSTLLILLQRVGDKNVWPSVHVSLVFLWSLTIVDTAMSYVEQDVPWVQLCSFLNNLARPEAMTANVLADAFPQASSVGRPLPEDFVIRGQVYSQWYFPDGWFQAAIVDDEERTQDPPSMVAPRIERILWLGMRIASVCRPISLDVCLHIRLTSISLVGGLSTTKMHTVSMSRNTLLKRQMRLVFQYILSMALAAMMV